MMTTCTYSESRASKGGLPFAPLENYQADRPPIRLSSSRNRSPERSADRALVAAILLGIALAMGLGIQRLGIMGVCGQRTQYPPPTQTLDAGGD